MMGLGITGELVLGLAQKRSEKPSPTSEPERNPFLLVNQ